MHLNERIEVLQKEWTALSRKIRKLEYQKRSLTRKRNRLDRNLKASPNKKSMGGLTDQKLRWDQQNEQLLADISDQRLQREALQKEIDRLMQTKQYPHRAKTIRALQDRREKKRQNIREARENLVKLDRQIEQISGYLSAHRLIRYYRHSLKKKRRLRIKKNLLAKKAGKLDNSLNILRRQLQTFESGAVQRQPGDVKGMARQTLNDKLFQKQQELEGLARQTSFLSNQMGKVEAQYDAFKVKRSRQEDALRDLKDAKKEQEQALSKLEGEKAQIEKEITEIEKEVATASDPRLVIETYSDRQPFALLPVKVQTRFMLVKHVETWTEDIIIGRGDTPPTRDDRTTPGAKTGKDPAGSGKDDPLPRKSIPDSRELWVRIFPDEIAINTHEERLTAGEYTAGKNYWTKLSEKSSSEEQQLDQWRILAGRYGAARAAYIRKTTKPSDEGGKFTFPDLKFKLSSWSSPAKSHVMPDRFVVRLYREDGSTIEHAGQTVPDPLILSMDPAEQDEQAFTQQNGRLRLSNKMKWMDRFEEAEKIGMGIRIPLNQADFEKGFSKLIVLGLKLKVSSAGTKELLEQLLDNHHYKKGGMAILPQGTPTNNTDQNKSGFQSRDKMQEESFRSECLGPLFTATSNLFEQTDGQRLADILGISHQVVAHLQKADQQDHAESYAMNCALWPATLWYYLHQMWGDYLDWQDVEAVRRFFTRYVHGRGPLPAIRINRQPYGILPVTAFSRWQQAEDSAAATFRKNLYQKVLSPLYQCWREWSGEAFHVGMQDKNPEDVMVNLLGLQPGSAQFKQRFAWGMESLERLLDLAEMVSQGVSIDPEFIDQMDAEALQKLPFLDAAKPPKAYRTRYFKNENRTLTGLLIDELPLSEIRRIKEFAAADPDVPTGKNYIHWLRESGITALRDESFSTVAGIQSGQKPPKALLYLMLRHAKLQSYLQAAYHLFQDAGLAGKEIVTEMEFTNFSAGGTIGQQQQQQGANFSRSQKRGAFTLEQNKWNYLDQSYGNLTGGMPTSTYIETQIQKMKGDMETLENLNTSLDTLKDLPTARLERLFTEHVDSCHYRLDAWISGLVQQRLEEQMQSSKAGIRLGAYAWVENLKPNLNFPGITVKEIPRRTGGTGGPITPQRGKKMFRYIGEAPSSAELLELDTATNQVKAVARKNPLSLGFIHGPSTQHALAAAIMRGAFEAHREVGTTTNKNAFAINLHSGRSRLAQYYLEGMQNGQSLGELLGYRLERILHDNFDEKNGHVTALDGEINALRSAFPLQPAGIVVDGLKIIENRRNNTQEWSDCKDAINSGYLAEIEKAIDEIDQHRDAVADLLMAESVFQVAGGNHERAGAVLKNLGKGNYLPLPDILKTPKHSRVLTNRFGIHLPAGNSRAWAKNQASPRSLAEPALNAWLAEILPPPEKMRIYYQPATTDQPLQDLKVSDIGGFLQPIDLVYLMGDREQGALQSDFLPMATIFVKARLGLSNEEPLSIDLHDRRGIGPGVVTLFELQPLVRCIMEMIGKCRPLGPQDFTPPNAPLDKLDKGGWEPEELKHRFFGSEGSFSSLRTLKDELSKRYQDLEHQMDNTTWFNELKGLSFLAYSFGITGGFSSAEKPDEAFLRQIASVIHQIETKIRDTEALISQWNPTDQDQWNTGDNSNGRQKVAHLQKIAQAIFGRSFRVFPTFQYYQSPVAAQNWIPSFLEPDSRERLEIKSWLFGLAKVKPTLANFQRMKLLADALTEQNSWDLAVAQLPEVTDQDGKRLWLAREFPQDKAMPKDPLSLVMEIPEDYIDQETHQGLFIDDWPEKMPNGNITTGLALNLDQPNAEAPQTVLLAVSPQLSGTWTWERLMDILEETIDLARIRAVDPDILQNKFTAQVLPAIVASINGEDKGPQLDLARNIKQRANGAVGPIKEAYPYSGHGHT